jgi:phosphoribosylcarboxyaminoimidazole (NCAIR) mutase
VAAHTSLPVIGVPLGSSPLGGADALLSTVQMPAGVLSRPSPSARPGPRTRVSCRAILALSDPTLRRLDELKVRLARGAKLQRP